MTRTRRVTPRDPLLYGISTVGIIAGAMGAVYPTALLGERQAPGVVAAVLLGVAGALGAGALWGPVVAVLVSASQADGGPRVLAHALGVSQVQHRAAEVRDLWMFVLAAALGGSVGGLVCEFGQMVSVGHGSSLTALAPDLTSVLGALAVCAVALLVGTLLGAASTSATAGLVAAVVAVLTGLLLLGAAYFIPALGPLASATPAAFVVVVVRSALVAPELTDQLSVPVASVSAVGWLVAVAGLAARRVMRGVEP